MDTTETVGLGQLADKVAALAREGIAGAEFLSIPKGIVGPGAIVDNPQLLVITNGKGEVKIESLTPHLRELRGKPARRTGTAIVTTLASFCDLVNRNGDEQSVIFLDATWTAPKVTAVLNYHQEAKSDADIQHDPIPAGDDPLARFGDHRVVYAFPLSEPWKAWVAGHGKFMKASAFALFLEERIAEIAMPDTDPDGMEAQWEQRFRTRIASPNELIDLARDLSIVENATIKTKTRPQSGETAIVFETEHVDLQGQAVNVPGLFVLSLPIFFRGVPQRVLARLRYRPAGADGVLWAYELHRPEEAVDERVRADASEIAFQTGRLVIDGAPEAVA